MNKELRSALILLLAAAIWGAAMSAQREGARYLSPFTFNACRFTLGALVMLPLMLRETKAAGQKRQAKGGILPGAVLGVFLFSASLLQQMAVQDGQPAVHGRVGRKPRFKGMNMGR